MPDTVTPAQLAASELRVERRMDRIERKIDKLTMMQGGHPNPWINFLRSREFHTLIIALGGSLAFWLNGGAPSATAVATAPVGQHAILAAEAASPPAPVADAPPGP